MRYRRDDWDDPREWRWRWHGPVRPLHWILRAEIAIAKFILAAALAIVALIVIMATVAFVAPS
jgi:hypothetical protein